MFSFGKKEGVSSDLDRLEQVKPFVKRLEEFIKEAEFLEDSENFKNKMIDIESQYDLVCTMFKKTIHGAQYFREKEGVFRDSLETSENIIKYIHTPLEDFNVIEKRLQLLRRRLENSLHDDKYSD